MRQCRTIGLSMHPAYSDAARKMAEALGLSISAFFQQLIRRELGLPNVFELIVPEQMKRARTAALSPAVKAQATPPPAPLPDVSAVPEAETEWAELAKAKTRIGTATVPKDQVDQAIEAGVRTAVSELIRKVNRLPEKKTS